jgi:hypothetical protein
LLILGIMAGAIAPDSGFNPKDIHPWGLVSTLIVYAVNFAVKVGI